MGTSGVIIERYKRDEVKRCIEIEMVIKLADTLAVSIGYLVSKTNTELDNDTIYRIKKTVKLMVCFKDGSTLSGIYKCCRFSLITVHLIEITTNESRCQNCQKKENSF